MLVYKLIGDCGEMGREKRVSVLASKLNAGVALDSGFKME